MVRAIRSLLMGLVVFLGCASAAQPTWNERMRDLAQALFDLMPDLVRESPVQSPEYQAKVDRIYSLSSQIDDALAGHTSTAGPGIDPTLQIVSRLFKTNVLLAQMNEQAGNANQARRLMRSSVSYCIACHTSGQASGFPEIKDLSSKLAGLNWRERVELAAAVGQFEKVREWVQEALSASDRQVSSADLERAVRISLAASLRSTRDLRQVQELIDSVLSSPWPDPFLKESAQNWKRDLASVTAASEPRTPFGYIDLARKWIRDPSATADAPLDRRAEVRYLATSRLMHEFVRRFPSDPQIGEALYLLGVSYDGLRDLGLWTLHEFYYEACIRATPHSRLSARAFRRYERALQDEYSRPGTMPALVSGHLEELRILAN